MKGLGRLLGLGYRVLRKSIVGASGLSGLGLLILLAGSSALWQL